MKTLLGLTMCVVVTAAGGGIQYYLAGKTSAQTGGMRSQTMQLFYRNRPLSRKLVHFNCIGETTQRVVVTNPFGFVRFTNLPANGGCAITLVRKTPGYGMPQQVALPADAEEVIKIEIE